MGDTDGRGSGAGGAIFVRRTGCSIHRSASSERMPRATRYDFCRSIMRKIQDGMRQLPVSYTLDKPQKEVAEKMGDICGYAV